MTTRRLAPTPPPPARTLALSCPPTGGTSGVGVPQFQPQRRERPVAASSPPGGSGTTPGNVRTGQARHQALLALGGRSPFHPARVTTLPTEVSCVRRGHRTRTVHCVWLADAVLFCTGFRPQEVPPPDARCIVLRPLSMDGALQEPSLAPLKGAPERPR